MTTKIKFTKMHGAGNDLLREMIQSGVIRYGEEFKKSMEAGNWDLSKIDYDELAKSLATLVFGQMLAYRHEKAFPYVYPSYGIRLR